MEFFDQKRKAGRPALKPSQRQRKLAEMCVAAGMSHVEIAAVLGISKPTLELHFADELRNGRVRRFAEVLVLLDRAARRGSVSAMKFLATLFSGGTSAVVGKKQRQQQEAENVGGGEWGDDLYQIN
jgi:DNA-binding NarL/FixJ family response regulator